MKESGIEGLASHDGPESCVSPRKGSDEALTGEGAGRVLSREIHWVWGADAVFADGRQHNQWRYRKSRKSDSLVVCARQRIGQEGSSPSDARMRSVVSKGGGNASPVEVRERYGKA